MSKLIVTIITATYNSEITIADTLTSVNSQTYNQIEHLIIDGISRDHTLDLIHRISPKAIIHQGKDSGIYDAMNKGISLAQGDIIGILNSDDFYASSTVIEDVVAKFEETGCDALYGDLDYVNESDTSRVTRRWISGNQKMNSFLYGWMPPHPTFFVKKSVYEKYGSFNLKLWSAADYELMLRFIYKNKISLAYLPKTLVKMRMGGQSNKSFKNRFIANKEDRLAWRINDLKPFWFTLYLKPLRKVAQFFIKS